MPTKSVARVRYPKGTREFLIFCAVLDQLIEKDKVALSDDFCHALGIIFSQWFFVLKMTKPSSPSNLSFPFQAWGQFYSLALIHASARSIRLNWGILEEMERRRSSFVITCWWTQALYCFFAFKKHRFPLVEIAPQQDLTFIIEKLGERVWRTPGASESEEAWQLFWQKLKEEQQFWFPMEAGQQGEKSFSNMVQWAQKQDLPLVPVGFSTTAHQGFLLSNGMRFPYPFSHVGVWVGPPIRMGNLPVDQVCCLVKQALHHPDELTQGLLQALRF